MKKRITMICLTLALFGYLIFLGRSNYLMVWLAENNFCYVWAGIVLMLIFRQDICAKWLTAGSILAVFPAQLMESLKGSFYKTEAIAATKSWGIPAWVALVGVSLAVGVWMQYRAWRKLHPKEAQAETSK